MVALLEARVLLQRLMPGMLREQDSQRCVLLDLPIELVKSPVAPDDDSFRRMFEHTTTVRIDLN